MADNVTIPATGTGDATPKVATDQDAGLAHHQLVKVEWGPLDTFNIVDTASGKALPVQVRSATGLIPIGEPTDAKSTATDTTSVSVVSVLKQISAMAQAPAATQVFGAAVTLSTAITRPGDTATYANNDAIANSTSAPTAGGFTFTGAGRASGGSGIITDLIVSSSNDPATPLQGEIWIYDSAVTTADNDNAAFTTSDSDVLLLVAVIPFTLLSTQGGSGTTSYAHVQNLSIAFTCVGTANLRFKVKAKNAYVPANAEVITFRLKIQQAT